MSGENQPSQASEAAWPWHEGGCHCGDVRFRVQAPLAMKVQACNCSICSKTGFLHWISPASRFVLLTDAAALTNYQFNTGTAQHLFCRRCGVKSYYVPRSNPDGFSVNVRCLDPMPTRTLTIEPFDGQNWEENASALAHLSQG